MQKILGYMRKAVQEYKMLSDGDKIAVGISGGKDSLTLLAGLVKLRDILHIDCEIAAVTVDAGFGSDFSEVTVLCNKLGVEYHIIPTHIKEIVFDLRAEKSPCSLCSRMRRGALTDFVKEKGFNKLALGHNQDDAMETFMMNLLTEGRIGCFLPVTALDDKGITMIRPLILASEKAVRHAARELCLPIVKSGCDADGNTNRQRTKELISLLEKMNRGTKKCIFGAIVRDIWKQ